jgi:hypothetical protein
LRFEANVAVGLFVPWRGRAVGGKLAWTCDGASETFPTGPRRTDCYIGLSRINRQKSEISSGVAQQQAATAIYRKVTGKRLNKKRRRAVSAW